MKRRPFVWAGWADFNSGDIGGFEFPPFGRRNSWFEPGEIRLAILSLLNEGPRHGYDLMKTMAARWGSARRISAGSVYPTLQQLEDEGLITSKREDGRRVYELTDAGRAELEENAEIVENMWKRAAGYEDWARWISPEMVMMWTPLGAVMKSTMRAVKKSHGDELLLRKIHGILERAKRELDDLRMR